MQICCLYYYYYVCNISNFHAMLSCFFVFSFLAFYLSSSIILFVTNPSILLMFCMFFTIAYFFCQYNYKMSTRNIFVLIYPVFKKRKFEFLVFLHRKFSNSFIFPCTEVIKSNRYMYGSRPIKFAVS